MCPVIPEALAWLYIKHSLPMCWICSDSAQSEFMNLQLIIKSKCGLNTEFIKSSHLVVINISSVLFIFQVSINSQGEL